MLKSKSSLISTLKKYKLSLGILVAGLIFILLFWREKEKVTGYITEPVISDYLPKTECGVVLTGASGRIREAFEVFAQKKFDHLIISGVYKDTQLHEIFPHLPFYPSIDPEKVILEKISGSTYGNAVQSLLVAETLKCKSVLLMTSDIHMYRAHRMFTAVFPESIQIKTYGITHTSREKQLVDVYFEAFKSLFYNILIAFAKATGQS